MKYEIKQFTLDAKMRISTICQTIKEFDKDNHSNSIMTRRRRILLTNLLECELEVLSESQTKQEHDEYIDFIKQRHFNEIKVISINRDSDKILINNILSRQRPNFTK